MTDATGTALIVGASRTLGLALAEELAARDWTVVATTRGDRRTGLHDLAERASGKVGIETLDMTDADQIADLGGRLTGRRIDLLFINGAIAGANVPASEVPAEEFATVMITNALSPMRVIAALEHLVPPTGAIGVMSSRQGSISLNTNGGNDVYRASKSALNQLMRSHAARHPDDPRTLLLIHPGHVQTDLGGAGAPLTIADSIPKVADVILTHRHDGGLHFLSYTDETVPW
ncbi:SDR family NAD(P)-dependent oxidoreductase [Phycicoccus endophyticus]|uniref:SDR family NAD(P)-dependent oxidoreductase n=1 Tax=Phycicoccus endophyticus TaxID=1690220 RepID=A0A7G9R3C0_9MICO|nr:SDR family NAD(P)-dependent oxidoreductase [Phycicoccus endophyticus]NHI19843.1 SDR family NAD(P)-dependent oxidoreductase [Phycicoccus endophyticus]QNN50095.1 SDR family NAD(P)-dependent oxidoreductase [Phycicoccus endophyticus]GGL28123.1 short-chain dehydrogenase [Phycicoccus endophyticus]